MPSKTDWKNGIHCEHLWTREAQDLYRTTYMRDSVIWRLPGKRGSNVKEDIDTYSTPMSIPCIRRNNIRLQTFEHLRYVFSSDILDGDYFEVGHVFCSDGVDLSFSGSAITR